jgi:hypothetical protein
MQSAIAKDRLPTAATASFDVDRYTAVGKNLHRKHLIVIGCSLAAQGVYDCIMHS